MGDEISRPGGLRHFRKCSAYTTNTSTSEEQDDTNYAEKGSEEVKLMKDWEDKNGSSLSQHVQISHMTQITYTTMASDKIAIYILLGQMRKGRRGRREMFKAR
mgnify:CR=1 FL=1